MTRVGLGAVIAAAVAAIAMSVVAGPAGAGDIPRTGDRVGILCVWAGACAATFTHDADAPFYIAHGFCDEPRATLLNGRTRFVLTVDGEVVPSIVDITQDHGTILCKTNLSNFAKGLPAGIHVFEGRWYRFGELDTNVGVVTRVGTFT